MPDSKNEDYIKDWNVIKNQVHQIEENNNKLVPITESCNRHTKACINEITPILEK